MGRKGDLVLEMCAAELHAAVQTVCVCRCSLHTPCAARSALRMEEGMCSAAWMLLSRVPCKTCMRRRPFVLGTPRWQAELGPCYQLSSVTICIIGPTPRTKQWRCQSAEVLRCKSLGQFSRGPLPACRSRQQTEVGKIVNHMSVDVNEVQNFAYPFGLQIISAPIMLIVSLILLYFQIK